MRADHPIAKLVSPLRHATGSYARGWRAAAADGCALVVVYHRIAAPRGEPPGFGVERGLALDVFESQLRFLRRHFAPVAPSRLAAAGLRGLTFAVTFDDGYADNLTLAAPVLERLGIPAAVLVTSDYIGTQRRFWWEQLGELLRGARAPALRVAEAAPALRGRWPMAEVLPLARSRERERAHWLLSMALMRTPPGEIDGLLEILAGAAEGPLVREGRSAPLLDWDGVRALRRHGLEVGAHGASHANLGLLPPREAEREVRVSVKRVAEELDAPVALFAYPYGGPEHRSPAAERAVAQSGCRAAFTTELGLVRSDASALALPRLGFTRGSHAACAFQTELAFRADADRAAAPA